MSDPNLPDGDQPVQPNSQGKAPSRKELFARLRQQIHEAIRYADYYAKWGELRGEKQPDGWQAYVMGGDPRDPSESFNHVTGRYKEHSPSGPYYNGGQSWSFRDLYCEKEHVHFTEMYRRLARDLRLKHPDDYAPGQDDGWRPPPKPAGQAPEAKPAPRAGKRPAGYWRRQHEADVALLRRWPKDLPAAAAYWGVPAASLLAVGVGLSREQAHLLNGRPFLLSFRLRDGEGGCVGLVLRCTEDWVVEEGKALEKRVQRYSGHGLVYPDTLDGLAPVGVGVVDEGHTNAAVYDALRLPYVCRSTAYVRENVLQAAAWFRRHPQLMPLVVIHRDERRLDDGTWLWPGLKWSACFARELAEELGRPVAVTLTPLDCEDIDGLKRWGECGFKDVRDWAAAQGLRHDSPAADWAAAGERLCGLLLAGALEVSPLRGGDFLAGAEADAGGGVAAENGLPAAAADKKSPPLKGLAPDHPPATLPREVKSAPEIEVLSQLPSSRARAPARANAPTTRAKRATATDSDTSSEKRGRASAEKAEAKPPPQLRTGYVPPVPFDFGTTADLEAAFGKPKYCRGAGLPWWFGYVLDRRAKVCALPMCKNPNCPACWPRRLTYSAAGVGCALDDNKDKQWGFIPSPAEDFPAQKREVERQGGVIIRIGKGALTTADLPGRQTLTVKEAWRKNLDLHKQADRPEPHKRLVTATQGVLPPSECGFHERPQRERLREVDRGLKAANAEARAAAREIEAALEDDDGGRWKAAQTAKSDAEGEQAALKAEKNRLLGKINVKKLVREERSDASLRTVERRADEIKTRNFTFKSVDNPELCGWSQAVRVRHGDKVPQKEVDRDTAYLRGHTLRPAAGHPWETDAEARKRLGGQAGAG
jgi:hypothetical protein